MLATIVGAIILGVILGYLAKLILPGRQDIPAWATIGAGIAAALLGGFVAVWLGVGDTRGIDWIKHILQLVFAIAAVAVVARLYAGRGRGPGRTTARS
ncbi:MAG: GlsB/YeaQ/YmgE family stress response membrane protein [Micromonosporaceae bacterium]|nr:GlsB/YeaQ/YmgE family stress response membrane protein [Micromonosporaceae bacterium]